MTQALFPTPFLRMSQRVKVGCSYKVVRDVMLTNLQHIKDDCLSDVPGVELYRRNKKTGKLFCCRGSSSNETDNMYLDLLTGKSIGVGRCDRLCHTFFEVSNFNKGMNRLGEEDNTCLPTHRTDKKAIVNSQRRSSGYGEDELPFKASQLAQPSKAQLERCDIGFDRAVALPSGETVGQVLNEESLEAVACSFGEESNPETIADDDESTTSDDSVLQEDETPEFAARVDALCPQIFARETTMEAFKRLTQQQPWVPFNINGNTILDQEEATLFDSATP